MLLYMVKLCTSIVLESTTRASRCSDAMDVWKAPSDIHDLRKLSLSYPKEGEDDCGV